MPLRNLASDPAALASLIGRKDGRKEAQRHQPVGCRRHSALCLGEPLLDGGDA